MSRLLSPAKICIVILIQIYRSNEVTFDKQLTLLSFISKFILSRSTSSSNEIESSHIPSLTRIDDIQRFLSPLSSSLPGRSLYDAFLRRVWSLVNVEQLGELLAADLHLIQGLDQQIIATPISPTSPVGQFLRRVDLEFQRLPFSEAYALFEDFVLFRQPSYDSWAKRNPTDAATVEQFGQMPGEPGHCAPILLERLQHRSTRASQHLFHDRDQLDRIIHDQIGFLQSNGSCLPDGMRAQLTDIINSCSPLPTGIHFIKFFDAWRAGAYNDAIDHLHRYFDYAVEGSQRDIKIYQQYALLHLAILHADFDSYEDAIAAMHECIATARENQDVRCLNFALLWLVHLRKAYPDYTLHESIQGSELFVANEMDILTFLQQKAVDTKDWLQVGTTLLAQAESELSRGGSIVKAIDLSYQSSHLINKYTLCSLSVPQTRLHGAIFSRLGQRALIDQCHDTMNNVYAFQASTHDLLTACGSRAYRCAISGHYDKAFEILDAFEQYKIGNTLKSINMHSGFVDMITCRRALHRGDSVTVEECLRRLRPLGHTSDADIAFETEVLEIMFLQQKGELERALEKIEDCSGQKQNSPATNLPHCIRLLILKANVWAAADRSSKGFSEALRAAAAARSRYLLPLLWEAIAALGTILIDHGEFEGVKALTESIMPQALEGGDTYLIGRLHSLMVEAHVGLAEQENRSKAIKRDAHLTQALKFLDLAINDFNLVGNIAAELECLLKKALLFRFKGEGALAEDIDSLYQSRLDESRRRVDAIQVVI